MTELQSDQRVAGHRGTHVPALDGLRGVAVLGVLLFHADLLPGGFLGVDLFFTLSGYLITALLLREAGRTGTVSLTAFWGRRVRRLLPALLTVLVVVTVGVWAFAPDDLVRTTLADGPWVQANLVNWHLLAESSGYWDRFGAHRVFEHLWSIAVEEQFYLVWPVAVLLLVRAGGRVEQRVAAVAALVCVVSLVLMVLLADAGDPTRVYTGTDTRAFSLLVGAVVAARPVRTALLRAVGRSVGAVTGLLAVCLAVSWVLANGVDSVWLFTGGLFAHSVCAAVLVALTAQSPDTVVAKGLSRPPLRWCGEISYSLYLWHWPVFVLLGAGEGGARTAGAFALSIGLATLSRYLVEDPVRFRAGWARGRTGLVVFAAAMTALALLWVLLPEPAAPVVDLTRLS
ncbi:Peptidoglycan/LPS O-acetylase OafA/YrhL, contains acyltransferase and SGNH-hydrolase domains [Lentzea fradiae]|uniref:Peptidoglycan/LPS O-acetylase OafA/YrhL, contains acyltransferase and SGNH-hydrolase domains n=1 Tax=Lentzea fradiae TaxID=200378 RepID=A0A1G7UKS5_9PSEU|nr:acyltransferase [Lentzea fradiae]SDG48172.1 Peptidoglycan/LPS O-acetylase OafA/YrhL, contains acyltransferase and SGNH-hydrolase domains [Lentzea fradiae]